MARPLPLRFFAKGAEPLARALLGKVMVAEVRGLRRRARITETEAYVGPHDLASHSRFGPTPRNASMFGPHGRSYVYLVYGMHHCLNVVAGSRNGEAVLLRAAEPLDGWRGRLGGPALLAKAFGVTRRLDGHDLRRPPLWLEEGPPPARVTAAPRVGVAYAGPWAHAPLRFRGTGDAAATPRRAFKAKRSAGPGG